MKKIISNVNNLQSALDDKADNSDVNANWQGNGYNLIQFPYYDGMSKVNSNITWEVDNNGVITANGLTNNTSYFGLYLNTTKHPDGFVVGKRYALILSVENGTASAYWNNAGTDIAFVRNVTNQTKVMTFTLNAFSVKSSIALYIGNAYGTQENCKCKCMIVEVDSNGNYPTEYQRYAMGNIELTNDMHTIKNEINSNWQGNGYNLIKFPYQVMDYTANGVHYVANSDGSIDISGEATGTSDYDFISYREGIMLPKGKYMVLCEETSTNKHMQVNLYDGNTYKSTIRNGVGEFEITQSIIDTGYVLRIYYRCSTNNIVDTDKIHPMLVKVNDDGTYPTEFQRYAMGNVELTDNVKGTVGGDAYSSTHTSKSGVSNKYDYGETCIYTNKVYWCKATSGVSASTLPTDTTYWEETSLSSLKLSLTNSYENVPVTFASGITSSYANAYRMGNIIIISGYIANVTSGYNRNILTIPYTAKVRSVGVINAQDSGSNPFAFNGYIQCSENSNSVYLSYVGNQTYVRFMIPIYI